MKRIAPLLDLTMLTLGGGVTHAAPRGTALCCQARLEANGQRATSVKTGLNSNNDSLLSTRRWILAVLVAALACIAVLPLNGATLTVTTTADTGTGSLRERLAAADSGDTIVFNVTGTITLTSGELVLNRSLNIVGPGANQLALSGNHASRVFHVNPSSTVAISGLTIRDGSVVATVPGLYVAGGGILNEGRLTLANSIVRGNYLEAGHGTVIIAAGIASGGGVYSPGWLLISNCSIFENTAIGGDGADDQGDPNYYAGDGGAAAGAGVCGNTSTHIVNSTVAHNIARGGKGGSAFVVNRPAGIGGGAVGGAQMWRVAACTNGTIAFNTAVAGLDGSGTSFGQSSISVGGVEIPNPGTVTFVNTIVARNTATASGNAFTPDVDGYGQGVSLGHNLIGVGGAGGPWVGSDLTGTAASPLDPRLLPLADYGGPTPTHALCYDSPARDAGGDSSVTVSTDQRGFSRTNGAHVDIGAFELQAGESMTVVVQNLNDSGPGSLRDALSCVPPGGTITFGPPGTITLTSGELVVNKSISILGPGPQRLAVSGGNASRVFAVFPETNSATISGLTIRDGLAVSPLPLQAAWGGAILNNATLTVSNCLFTGNRAVGLDGAIAQAGSGAQGGAIYNRARLTLFNSAFLNNRAQGGLGGNGANNTLNPGQPGGLAWGGALFAERPVTVLNCTFSTNTAAGGAGGRGGYVSSFDIYGPGGAGGEAAGGQLALDVPGETNDIVHTTLVGGRAQGGAGGFGDTGAGTGSAGIGSGGAVWTTRNTTRMLNTLVASNSLGPVSVPARGPDALGPFTSLGHNLVSIADGSSGWLGTDLNGSAASPRDPKLGALGLNFGFTPNFSLQTNSPALNAGDNISLGSPWFLATDQRGFPRRIAGIVDIGAYEVCRDESTFEVTTLADGVAGSLRAAIACLAPGGTITFAPGMTGTIRLELGELVIDKDLTLLGPGASWLSLQGHSNRVVRVVSGRVMITGVTVTGGSVVGTRGTVSLNLGEDGGDGGDAEGGGILNHGDLTLVDCMVNGCFAGGGDGGTGGPNFAIAPPGTGGAGGDARGGGVCNRGRLTSLRCTFGWNVCYGGWGGTGGVDSDIRSTPGGLGGSGGWATGAGLYNAGTLFATNCTFITNLVNSGNGGGGGYGIPQGGDGGNGGAALGAGFADEGVAVLVSCTLAGNRGQAGQGGVGGAGSVTSGSNGTAGIAAGGGMYFDNVPPQAYVRNTLSAGNVSANSSDTIGPVSSGGFNFIGLFNDGPISSANPFTEPTDQVGIWPTTLNARLGPLGYFGGMTLVQSLQANSPAIDKGHASGTATDQRGQPRPGDQPWMANTPGGDGSDIGAFELEPPLVLRIRLGAPIGGVNTVILSWPNPSTGYVLQQTANMNAPGGGWVDVTQPPVIVGPNKEVTLQATGQVCFFRLRPQ